MMGLQPNPRRDQLAGIPGTTIPLAAQACATCRRQKRRCDKLLPACSRCASLRRACDYAEAGGGASAAPTAEDFAALQNKLVEIEARLQNPSPAPVPVPDFSGADAGSAPGRGPADGAARSASWTSGRGGGGGGPVVTNRLQGAFFLDMEMYKFAGLAPPKPVVDMPMEVIEVLDSSEVIEQAASAYFNTIHKWFPFISRKRMNLGLSLARGGPDLALLFLAMKLVTTTPPSELVSAADLPLYRTSKRFMALLETAGTVSLPCLQAMILVALYEYGHAIYPAAWMSVGNCVRYAAMLGLPSYGEAAAVLGNCTTWTEAEERRRVYWATHILDRAVSLGSKRPFAGGPDPPPDAELLPVDDLAWDAGDMGRAPRRPVGTPLDRPQPGAGLARLAQASLLVTRGVAHCRRAVRWHERPAGAAGDGGGGGGDDADMDGGGGRQDGGAGAGRDLAPLNIREVTALVTEMSGFCGAIGEDMAGAGADADAYWALTPARCLSWSTAIMVLDLYSCPEHMRPGAGPGTAEDRGEAELALQVEAINGLKAAAVRVREVAVEVLEALDGGGGVGGTGAGDGFLPWTEFSGGGSEISLGGEEGEVKTVDKFSPLCLDTLYCALSTFEWLWRENGDPEMKQGLDVTKRCLERVGKRWRLASEYLEVEKLHNVEAMLAMGSNSA